MPSPFEVKSNLKNYKQLKGRRVRVLSRTRAKNNERKR